LFKDFEAPVMALNASLTQEAAISAFVDAIAGIIFLTTPRVWL